MADYQQIRDATGHTGTTGLSDYPIAATDRDVILSSNGHIRIDNRDEHTSTPVTVLPHEVMAAHCATTGGH